MSSCSFCSQSVCLDRNIYASFSVVGMSAGETITIRATVLSERVVGFFGILNLKSMNNVCIEILSSF